MDNAQIAGAKAAYAYLEKEKRLRFDFYEPHPKHLEFHNLGVVAKERLFLAANRIGKTMACSLEVCMHLTGSYPEWWQGYRYNKPINAWVAGVSSKEVHGLLERRYFEGVTNELPWIHPSLITYRNRINHVYRIKHTSGDTSCLRFKTYEQGREAWQGEKLDLCHLDEEPPLEIYTEALMRLMATDPTHHGMMLVSATCLYLSPFVLSFTERCEKRDDGEVKQIQNTEGKVVNSRVFLMAGWDDAPHLSVDEKTRFQEAIPPHEIEARSKGIPSLGSGMVYPISENLITVEPFAIPGHWARVYGMDFGWKDPTAVIFAAIDRDKDTVYFIDEYAKSELTPQIHSLELLRKGCNWMPGVYDPSGKISNQKDGSNLVSLYHEAGLRHLYRADNGREEGVQKTLQKMQRGQLKIFKSLTQTLKELRMYARDQEGKIKDGNDHLLDAMRYVITSGLRYARCQKDYDNRPKLPSKYALPSY